MFSKESPDQNRMFIVPNEHYDFELEARYIDVGDGHTIATAHYGHGEKHVMCTHGGPGGKIDGSFLDLFDPEEHKVVVFDQRSSGRSAHNGRSRFSGLTANTTEHLIKDIDVIADTYNIEEFNASGGSWASILWMAYAAQNPDRVESMVLWSIVTDPSRYLDDFSNEAAQEVMGDAIDVFRDTVNGDREDSFSDLIIKANQQMHSNGFIAKRKTQEAIRRIYNIASRPIDSLTGYYELTAKDFRVPLLADYMLTQYFSKGDPLAELALMLDYFANNMHIPEALLPLNNINILSSINTTFVCGEQDLNTQPAAAKELAEKIGARVVSVANAGHPRDDRGMRDAIRSANLDSFN